MPTAMCATVTTTMTAVTTLSCRHWHHPNPPTHKPRPTQQSLVRAVLVRQSKHRRAAPLDQLRAERVRLEHIAQRVRHPQGPQLRAVRLVVLRQACDGSTALQRHGDVGGVDLKEQGEALARAGGVHERPVVFVQAELEDGATAELDDGLVLAGDFKKRVGRQKEWVLKSGER